MFSVTNKIRTIIALGAVAAAVAVSGVASAAIPVHRPGTGTVTITRIVAPPPIVADETVDPNKVGSAGIAGYDDETCQGLANQVNSAMKGANAAGEDGDTATANDLYGLAQDKDAELEDNCLVID
jgi:hypothetical protein